MDGKKIFNAIMDKAQRYSRKTIIEKREKVHYRRLERENIPLRKLTAEQKRQIDEVWGELAFKNDYSTHELIYSITGDFNPYYCSEKLFAVKIEFMMIDNAYLKAWSDKNYFDKLFPDVRFPETIVRNVAGIFYDKDYNIISTEEAKKILSSYEYACIKPSIDTGCGRGVAKIKIDDKIDDVLKSYKDDFIIQELIDQYPEIKKLNESSVNVLRVNSLFIGGEPKFVSSSLRVGAPGAFNDNSILKGGKGMLVIGVDENGKLKDKAYESCGVSFDKTHNGTEFKGIQIPNYDKIKEYAFRIHSQMPFTKFVGFDIALDANGDVVLVEYNPKAPGIFYYQLVNGPLFGEYTKDLIKDLTRK